MGDVEDRPRGVRSGEELDATRLEAYLREHVPGADGALTVHQFPSGHSNLTYLVAMGDREWVLRRPPFGSKVKTAHDMGREHRILSRLHAVFPPAPKPVLYCDDAAVLGAPFYLMERVRGIILRRGVPDGLDLGPATMRRLCESLIDTLADLHTLDFRAAGLGELGKPEGYNERQVTGWTRRYRDAKTDALEDVEKIAAWLAARIPKESGASLLHNDYKFDNVVLDASEPTRIVGVLDWEMSTLGDPLMDLGTALGYWVEPDDSDELKMLAFGPTTLPGAMTRRELVARYAARTGREPSNMLFCYCFALFKTAVVLQQIYYRFRQGLTHDPRFGALIVGVRVLAKTAVDASERGAY